MLRLSLISLWCSMLLGCSSIPFLTMMKLSTFDENTLLSINPMQLKARVTIDQPDILVIGDATPALSLQLTSDGKELGYQFPLKLISSQEIPGEESLFHTIPARNVYELSFSDTAIEDFLSMRSEYQKLTQRPEFRLTVTFNSERPEDELNLPYQTTISVDLKFSETSNYLTLIDRYAFTVETN